MVRTSYRSDAGWRRITPLLVVAALTLSACTAANNSDPSPTTLTWAKPSDVIGTDPGTTGASATDWELFAVVYDTLVRLDGDGVVLPGLAESFEQVSPTEYQFTIRENAVFSNGRTLTVDDVTGTLDRIMDPSLGSSMAAQLGIASTSAAGNVVTVTLAEPKTSFVAALANAMASILPMTELEDGSFDPTKELLGTGPYMVESHVEGQSWKLVRNPEYWGEPARVETVEVRIVPDDAARVAGLRDGSIDFTSFDLPDATTLLEGAANVETLVVDTSDYYRLDVNAITGAFSDPLLREALALAIDRRQIIDVALGGVGEPSAAFAPAFGVCDAADIEGGHLDVERAIELVAEAGATGTQVSIIAAPSYNTFPAIAQVLQSNLEAIGLEVEILQLEDGAWFETVFSGKPTDFNLSLSFFAGGADPVAVLPYYSPVSIPPFAGFLNSNPELDAVSAAASSTESGPERDELLREACELIAADANIIPLVTKPLVIAYRADQVGTVFNSSEFSGVPFRNLAEFEVR